MPRPVTGEVIVTNSKPDKIKRVTESSYAIYVYKGRPSVFELIHWCDKNSVVVATGGSVNSEDMNFARAKGITYVNGAQNGHWDLANYEGEIVTIASK